MTFIHWLFPLILDVKVLHVCLQTCLCFELRQVRVYFRFKISKSLLGMQKYGLFPCSILPLSLLQYYDIILLHIMSCFYFLAIKAK